MASSAIAYTVAATTATVVNNASTSMVIKNTSNETIYVSAYAGSAADNSTTTVTLGAGYPLKPNETVTWNGGKALLNLESSNRETCTIWVVAG